MIKNKLTKYILIQNLNENNIKNIKKLTNIKIIYNNEEFNDISLKECKKIKHFCKINKIQFYIINNYKAIHPCIKLIHNTAKSLLRRSIPYIDSDLLKLV